MFPEHSPSVDIQWMAMVDCTDILHLPLKQSLRPTAKVMETYSTNGLYLLLHLDHGLHCLSLTVDIC